MKTQSNQDAINSFFEGYGFDTVKEYGQTLFEIINLLQQRQQVTEAFREEVTGKITSIYRLISSLESDDFPRPQMNN